MQTLVKQLILQLTGNADMFTAFDITMMLRRANPSTNVRHGEVRDIVHNLYEGNQMNGFVRTLQRMDSGQDTFVYHVYGTDAEDYDPNFFAQSTPQSVSVPIVSAQVIQVAANPMTQMTTSTSQTGNQTRRTIQTVPVGNSLPLRPKRARYDIDSVPKDKFGRIRIPASVMRASGFAPKDTVRVVIDPNLITVTNGNDPNGVLNGKKYVVDEYNNIRVHLKGKFPADKFKMQPSMTRIFIAPV